MDGVLHDFALFCLRKIDGLCQPPMALWALATRLEVDSVKNSSTMNV